ncbi:MAG: pyridoxamine 5'-phosphate oxidase family protein [Peptococcaceae bacterium]|jgi:nitroimidazol reductase NimA-like FMN-containing flavoprotein (pyridoxamine 5'-phosphate oxidase superfamily)|nr:pyridoxamine 5'-phosphate oxidase family protein [Peptococcaceae bacterium]
MEQIRYTQRICADRGKIEDFLARMRIGVLGMSSGAYPYCVPVNYVWRGGAVYFHGLGSGKKTEILLKEPPVSFTVFEEYGTVKDEVPCHADTAYLSVMIFGKAERVADVNEGAAALQAIVEKYMPAHYKSKLSGALIEKYRSSHDQRAVSIFRIVPLAMTAKENSAAAEDLFSGEASGSPG